MFKSYQNDEVVQFEQEINSSNPRKLRPLYGLGLGAFLLLVGFAGLAFTGHKISDVWTSNQITSSLKADSDSHVFSVFESINVNTVLTVSDLGEEGVSVSGDLKGTVLATSASTIFYSSDYGSTLSSVSFDSSTLTGVSYSNGSALASTAGGFLKSSDSGASWASSLPGPEGVSVSLSKNGYAVAASVANLYQTLDGGESWSRTKTVDGSEFTQVSSEATNGQFVLALLSTGSVVYSEDYGATWSESASITTTDDGGGSTAATIVSVASCETASFAVSSSSSAVYMSTDHGASWTLSSDAPDHDYNIVACAGNVVVAAAPGYVCVNVGAGTGSWQCSQAFEMSSLSLSSDGSTVLTAYATSGTQLFSAYVSLTSTD